MLDILLPDPTILARRPDIHRALIIMEEQRRAFDSDALTASSRTVERRKDRPLTTQTKDCMQR